MDHSVGSTFYGFKGFLDNVLSGLGQYLDGHILRNEILLDQGAQKFIFCLRGCRRSQDNYNIQDIIRAATAFLRIAA